MKIKLPTFKRNPEKERALALARQAAAFYDIAARKGGMAVTERNKKHRQRRIQRLIDWGVLERKPRVKEPKPKYIPGTLGFSAVSEAIKTDYGRIISRRERKRLASKDNPFHVPFKPCYNGEVVKR